MKKLLILFFLFQTLNNYAQSTIDPNAFAVKFTESVNNQIDIFPKEDLALLESNPVGKSDETVAYLIQLGRIPVSEAFIKANPKSDKLLKELYAAFKPLVDNWSPDEADDSEEITAQILDAMGKQTNGTAVQYLFIYCLYTLDDQNPE
jgi:hypothetical protein